MNNTTYKIFVIVAACLCAFMLNGREINILDYGALPDGKSLNTISIQQAIADAS